MTAKTSAASHADYTPPAGYKLVKAIPEGFALAKDEPASDTPDYSQMVLSSDIVTAAGLRNGMTPAQINESVARVMKNRVGATLG